MKLRHFAVAIALLLASCASTARVDSAVMPPGLFPAGDEDQSALREALLTLGASGTLPATVQGRARSFADVEFVSGVFNTSARWIGLDGTAQIQILMARREVRDHLGLPEQAKSQAVVDGLIAVSTTTDQPALMTALANPIFTLGPQATLARLQETPHFLTLPYALANVNHGIGRLQSGSDAGDSMRM
jgi:hypothetical protein